MFLYFLLGIVICTFNIEGFNIKDNDKMQNKNDNTKYKGYSEPVFPINTFYFHKLYIYYKKVLNALMNIIFRNNAIQNINNITCSNAETQKTSNDVKNYLLLDKKENIKEDDILFNIDKTQDLLENNYFKNKKTMQPKIENINKNSSTNGCESSNDPFNYSHLLNTNNKSINIEKLFNYEKAESFNNKNRFENKKPFRSNFKSVNNTNVRNNKNLGLSKSPFWNKHYNKSSVNDLLDNDKNIRPKSTKKISNIYRATSKLDNKLNKKHKKNIDPVDIYIYEQRISVKPNKTNQEKKSYTNSNSRSIYAGDFANLDKLSSNNIYDLSSKKYQSDQLYNDKMNKKLLYKQKLLKFHEYQNNTLESLVRNQPDLPDYEKTFNYIKTTFYDSFKLIDDLLKTELRNIASLLEICTKSFSNKMKKNLADKKENIKNNLDKIIDLLKQRIIETLNKTQIENGNILDFDAIRNNVYEIFISFADEINKIFEKEYDFTMLVTEIVQQKTTMMYNDIIYNVSDLKNSDPILPKLKFDIEDEILETMVKYRKSFFEKIKSLIYSKVYAVFENIVLNEQILNQIISDIRKNLEDFKLQFINFCEMEQKDLRKYILKAIQQMNIFIKRNLLDSFNQIDQRTQQIFNDAKKSQFSELNKIIDGNNENILRNVLKYIPVH